MRDEFEFMILPITLRAVAWKQLSNIFRDITKKVKWRKRK